MSKKVKDFFTCKSRVRGCVSSHHRRLSYKKAKLILGEPENLFMFSSSAAIYSTESCENYGWTNHHHLLDQRRKKGVNDSEEGKPEPEGKEERRLKLVQIRVRVLFRFLLPMFAHFYDE